MLAHRPTAAAAAAGCGSTEGWTHLSQTGPRLVFSGETPPGTGGPLHISANVEVQILPARVFF